MSIRLKTIMVIVLMSISIVVIGLGSGLIFTDSHFKKVVESDMTVVADAADRIISAEFAYLHAMVSATGSRIYALPDDALSAALAEELNANDTFISLTVIEADRVVAYAGTPYLQSALFAEDFVTRAFEGTRMISSTVRDDETGQVVFYICSLLPSRDGAPPRLISAVLDGLYFSYILDGLVIWETGHIFIDDAEGYVLANIRHNWVLDRQNFINMSLEDPQYEHIAAVITKMIQGQQGIDTFALYGVDRYCSYRPVSASESGWSLGVIAPVDESPLPKFRNGLILVGLVCLLLSVIAAIIASKIIVNPYQTISAMMDSLETRDEMLATVNQMAALLMESRTDTFTEDIQSAMGMLAQRIGVDKVQLWQNDPQEEQIYCTRVYEWNEGKSNYSADADQNTIEMLPLWVATLSSGACINGIVRTLSEDEQKLLSAQGIKSILAVPLFIQNNFWGFIAFCDSNNEREFSASDEKLLYSGGLTAANAIMRNNLLIDLINAREEAIANSEAKSHFLANMSHEMRTPLNAIIGLSELSLGSNELQHEDFQNLSNIYNSGVTLFGLINDILDLSKIDSGKFEIIPDVYDTPSLINDTVTLNSVHAGSKPIEFVLNIDETLPLKLQGDDLRVKQLFNNLLSNAFKYTKEGTVEWTISWEQDAGGVWLISSVRDTGVGIREDDLKRLFSDYNQVDTKSNRQIKGTGLGLSISKRLAEMMGGWIAVESEYGKGSTFSVRIRQESVTSDAIGHDVVEKLKKFQYSEHRRDRSAKLIRVYIPYARVLVVDDVVTNLDVAKGLLKPYGMQVDCVTTGQEAIELIQNGTDKYDAIFMDHMMPGMDGIEATARIREINTEYAKTVPIIALTANAIVGNEEMFLQNGFQAFLSKPIDIMALDAAVNHWVRDKAQEKKPVAAASGEQGDEHPESHGMDILFSNPIPGLNVDMGIGYFDGDLESYWFILESYAKNTAPLLEKLSLESINSPAELANYGVIVHGIKSSSQTIGATDVSSQAASLEMATKESNITFIKSHHAGFIDKTQTLIEDISFMINALHKYDAKPIKTEPDQALLAELLSACKTFDIEAVERIIKELESYTYESQNDLVLWLRERIDIMEFRQIETRLLHEGIEAPG